MDYFERIKTLYGRVSIRSKMLAFILLLTAAGFICAFVMISTVYRNNNIAKSHEDNVRTLKNIATQFSISREEVNSFMLDVHGDGAFMESLIKMAQIDRSSGELPRHVAQAQKSIRDNLRLKEDLLIAEVHVSGCPEAKISVLRSNPLGLWHEFEEKYMSLVLEKAGELLVYMPANVNQLVFSRAQPIMDGAKVCGFYCINVAFSQNRITQILKQNMADSSRQAILFDESGTIYSRTSSVFSNLSASDLDVPFGGNGICTNSTGEWVYDVQLIQDVNMYVCVMTQMSSIDLTSQSFLGSVRIILIAMISMASLIAILITKWINRPIRELTRQFGEILNDSPRKQLNITGSDELKSVAEGINAVLEKQELLIRDNYRSKILEKNARIELLQVQINPHFVFNTLDIINWFIYENRNKEASRVLVALGEMMRYSTYRYKSFVTLSEEIKQIRNYLHIQLIRYDYSFGVDIEVEDGLDDFMIPCLIIQPIIENAVKYGVTRKESGGRLCLSAVRGSDALTITVFDNGVGMTGEQIKQALDADVTLESSTSGVGLRNVNQRMMLLFGTKYAISVESELGYYTQVTIKLPLRGENNEDNHR